MKDKILKEITDFCEERASHECCPEKDCVLYRIEQLVVDDEDNASNTKLEEE